MEMNSRNVCILFNMNPQTFRELSTKKGEEILTDNEDFRKKLVSFPKPRVMDWYSYLLLPWLSSMVVGEFFHVLGHALGNLTSNLY